MVELAKAAKMGVLDPPHTHCLNSSSIRSMLKDLHFSPK